MSYTRHVEHRHGGLKGRVMFRRVQGRDKVPMRVSGDFVRTIQNVLYVLGLKTNLLSVSKIIDKKYIVVFYKKQCLIKDRNNKMMAQGLRWNNMYRFDGIPKNNKLF